MRDLALRLRLSIAGEERAGTRERNDEILRRWRAGETLAALGREHGLSGERMRTVIARRLFQEKTYGNAAD